MHHLIKKKTKIKSINYLKNNLKSNNSSKYNCLGRYPHNLCIYIQINRNNDKHYLS